MATRRTTKETPKTNIVDMGNDYFLHYRDNDYKIFGLEHNGAVIYGCRLVENSKDKSIFLSYPSRKGNDGKYYCHARFTARIPDSVLEKIADAIGF